MREMSSIPQLHIYNMTQVTIWYRQSVKKEYQFYYQFTEVDKYQRFIQY